jgi:hypothetical protein
MRSFCFIIAFLNFATLENRLTYQFSAGCHHNEEEISRHLEKKRKKGYWPVQINGNKFATGQILQETGKSCEGAAFSWLSTKVSPTLQLTTLH